MMMAEWNMSQLMFADDTVLLADSQEEFKKLVDEIRRVCSRKLRLNKSKRKVMKCTKMMVNRKMNVTKNEKPLEKG